MGIKCKPNSDLHTVFNLPTKYVQTLALQCESGETSKTKNTYVVSEPTLDKKLHERLI